jgi:hypothetical protein
MQKSSVLLATLFLTGMPPLYAQRTDKTRIIDIEGLVIEGEIQRPEAFFILNRDEPDIFSTLTLDPTSDAQRQIEEWARSEIFR